MIESALNDFYILTEAPDWLINIFGGIGEGIKNIGSIIHDTAKGALNWITTKDSSKTGWDQNTNSLVKTAQECIKKAQNAIGGSQNLQMITGGAAVLAGLYLIKKFMSRKDKNQKMDPETLNRANALANLPQDQARKMLMQMK